MRSRPERDAAVRRRAVLERVHEEAEAQARLLVADVQQPEDLALDGGIVDTDAAAARSRCRSARGRRLSRAPSRDRVCRSREVLVVRRRERVVHRRPPLLVRVPVEQREIHDPGERERVGRDQVLLLRERQPEGAEQLRRRVRPRHRRAGSGPRSPQPAASIASSSVASPAAFTFVLMRALDLARPEDADRAELLGLIDERIELRPRVARAAGNHERPHDAALRDDLAERVERRPRPTRGTRPRSRGRSAGRACRSRTSPSPRRTAAAGTASATSTPISLKITLDQRLDHREDRVGPRERHLDVDLRELGLPIGAQVLVAEALHDLEVAIDAADHQDLLEDLRRLRQRVELARDARGSARGSRARLRAWTSSGSASRSPRSPARRSTGGSPSSRGGAARGCTAAAAAADRDSGTAAARPRTRSRRRRSETAASSPRSARGSRAATTSTSPVGSFGFTVSADRAAHHARARRRRTRTAAASPRRAARRRTTTCVMPSRSRTSMNSTPPRSRTRCTQPSSVTLRADVRRPQRAARVGAGQ